MLIKFISLNYYNKNLKTPLNALKQITDYLQRIQSLEELEI